MSLQERGNIHKNNERDWRPLNPDHMPSVIASLKGFAGRMNRGGIAEVYAPFQREDAGRKEGRFVVTPYWEQWGKWNQATFDVDGRQGRFAADGTYGFGLGFHYDGDDQPVWFAITTFILPKRSNPKDVREDDGPLILQLQGMSQKGTYMDEEKRVKAAQVMPTLAWEHAEVALMIAWAKQVHIPILYSRTAENVQHANADRILKDRAIRRYNQTAIDMGFVYNPTYNNFMLRLH